MLCTPTDAMSPSGFHLRCSLLRWTAKWQWQHNPRRQQSLSEGMGSSRSSIQTDGRLQLYAPCALASGSAVIQDRSSMKVPGVLVVAGDFPNNVTLNVSREKLSSLSLSQSFSQSQMRTAEGRQQFLDGAISAKASQDTMFEFSVLSTAFREEQDGRVYLELEFKESTCKGDVIEGLRGRKRCVDVFDNTISTPEKHAFQVATVGQDGYVYTATGGTLDSKFAAAADNLRQAARTFRVA